MMKNFRSTIVMFCLLISLVSCVPRRKKSDTTQTFHTTGEAIAIDELIQQYEKEHQKLFEEITKGGDYLKWPDMDNKNLSNYCKKYLQKITPTKKNQATPIKKRMILHYEKENTDIINEIDIVQCKITYNTNKLSFYMTRAPEPNCVYAVKSTGDWNNYKFAIINKHCDFEDEFIMNRVLKRKRDEIITRKHPETGQPVAKDKYLLEFELQHKEMVKKAGEKGEVIQWPYAMVHPNLNSYCYQYIRECSPHRKREGVRGKWKPGELYYEKLNSYIKVIVTTVICSLSSGKQRPFYMTRAPENNCVYALLRKGCNEYSPFIIIFKHCDFEDPNPNDQQTKPQEIAFS